MADQSATEQRYAIEGYASPSSYMDQRSAYQFTRRQIAAAIEAWADGRTFDRLVDIGSSTGFLTKRIKHLARRVVALDASEKALAAIADPDIETVEDRLPELGSLAEESVDLVVCTDTLYYLSDEDLAASMARIAAILRPGGYLVFNRNEGIDRIAGEAGKHLRETARLTGEHQLSLDPDRLFWLVESRYMFVKGLFRALRDPRFDRNAGLSELMDFRTVRLCLRHPWLENWLVLAWPVRRLARFIWSNDRLLNAFCVVRRPATLLWVYRKPG